MGLNFQDVIRRIYDENTNTIGTRSGATVFAVVNTSAAGVGQSLVTVLNPVSIAGNVTIDSGNIVLTSAPTLYAVVNTSATNPSNVTIDSGTLTAVTDITNPVALKGNLTIDSGTVSVDSLPATPAGANYIGLATVDIGSAPTLTVDATGQGDVPVTLDGEQVTATIKGNVTVDQVDVVTTITNPVATKGNVTIDSGVITTVTAVTDVTNPIAIKGNLTIDQVDAVTEITNPVALKGNVTIVDGGGSITVDGNVGLLGNVTLSNSNAYVGLATVDVGKAERYSYAYTSGPTTDWIVKGSAGFVHAIHVGAAVASSIIEMSDHASDGDAAVKIYQAGDTIGPAVYPLNMTMGTGITLDITNQTHVTVIYK